ncbi:hypothetical protein IMF27_04280 [Pseudomonas sp. PCH199]|uniref:hypothetical protein n=1 Tax=unclassified Pseudomonas TaxID=196821 RepID=UPI000BC5684A|nr:MULTISPECIES: hypothetical protein [unclassified Pseudomonas]MCW8275014.1 hypothetical protein [Pseudomonas sp. PCH199]PAM84690.1 hypothetical protein CES87_04365 [Pseudomonas sp. ERMR1:02]
MAAKTAVHSNAFNFLSFQQSGVDPRTGQYTVNLSLPEIKANGLSGPVVPMNLSFNPLNQDDLGLAWAGSCGCLNSTPTNKSSHCSTVKPSRSLAAPAVACRWPSKKSRAFTCTKMNRPSIGGA